MTANAKVQQPRTRSGVCATMPKACAKSRAVFGVRWNALLGLSHACVSVSLGEKNRTPKYTKLNNATTKAGQSIAPEITKSAYLLRIIKNFKLKNGGSHKRTTHHFEIPISIARRMANGVNTAKTNKPHAKVISRYQGDGVSLPSSRAIKA